MNERIRELMIQSNPHGDFKDCEWVFEKFAQLIVRECANRIDYWESRQGEHSDDLLKHFGVGE